MKAGQFILIAGLLVTAMLALLVFTEVWPEQARQDGGTLTLTKNDVFVVDSPDGHNDDTSTTFNGRPSDDTPETLSSHPGMPPAGPAVVFANPAPKTDISPFEDLPVSDGKPGLLVGQKANDLPVSDGKPNLPVSRRHRSMGPVGATDETEPNPVGIDGSRFNSPEVYGQNGEVLPSPEEVLARKAQSILRNYKDRKAEAVIISEEVVGDDYETKLSEQSLKDDTGPDSANTGEHTETVATVTDVASTVEMLANQNTSDKAVDSELQVNQLLAALAESNPVEVRLQAIYLLADVAPDLVGKFLDDKEDIIRCEAERIVGILPQDY